MHVDRGIPACAEKTTVKNGEYTMKTKCRRGILLLLITLVLAPVQARAGLNLESFEAFKAQTAGYSVCEQGDSGSNVLRIKERMQDLGYYRKTASLGDDFNDTMVQRVKLFQENNGIDVTGKVDSSTLQKLRESNPARGEYYEGTWNEPDVTMIIPYSTWGRWNKMSEDRFSFAIKTKNISTSRKIKAVEYLIYTEDVWGSEIISSSRPYTYTLTETYAPGEMKYTGYMNVPYRSETYKVYIAINKVLYGDGTVEYASSPEYWNWTIEW